MGYALINIFNEYRGGARGGGAAWPRPPQSCKSGEAKVSFGAPKCKVNQNKSK